MAEPLVLVDLVQTCGACPSQWEARTPDGRCVYIRYRHYELSVGVGDDDGAAVNAGIDEPYLEVKWDDGGSGGRMTTAEMLAIANFQFTPVPPKEA